MKKMSKLEAVFWNIAFPGFSQLLMGQYIKGILFVTLEVMINSNSHFNSAIMYSFLGEINNAEKVLNYQWLMFYPCVYLFSLWDGYRSAMPENEKYSFFPFVFGAYFVTVGLMVSPKVTIFQIHPGPVFLPMLFLIPGLLIGFLIKFLLSLKFQK
ncbi:hypothetical protein M3610_02555 [Neobacillus sp. MER 74]|uniref:hypothetical protein n=1 Tax=Bacillaceae TaxID=186817 RepID=UPI000BF90E9F|nr:MULTISPECIES: hypothetical protein [Bacillaceae]MCM3114172.1 hypothetical protein [Neobacillus sp. MER 74]PFP29754.1 hypothetical protein COJ96_08690 [Bacillus sp. AFS073361]